MSRQALVDVGRRYRLVLIVCPIAGLTGLIVLSVLGYPVAGIALCAGLFMRAEFEYLRFTSTVDTSVSTARLGLGYKF